MEAHPEEGCDCHLTGCVQVWVIRVTGEVFTDYESYLARYVHQHVEQAGIHRLTRSQAGVPSPGKCSPHAS